MTNAVALQTKSHDGAATTAVFNFGKTLGTAHRRTLVESEPLHKSWVKCGPDKQATMKFEFLIGYISGVLGSERDAAETIIGGRVRYGANPQPGKPARTKPQQQAYDAARKMFAFHISREDRKVKDAVEVKKIRLSSEFKVEAAGFIGKFFEEVNAESISEVIKMLQALKQRITKVLPAGA